MRVLTEETAGDYDLSDVVLPLIGYAVFLPRNDVAQWYMDELGELGITDLAAFKTGARDFHLCGAYRKIVVKPRAESVKWRVQAYTKPDEELTISDAEMLAKATVDADGGKDVDAGVAGNPDSGSSASASSGAKDEAHQAPPLAESDGKMEALVLEFSLPSGCFATMLLREFLKTSTSSAFQATLNR